MARELTPIQRRILEFIQQYIADNQCPPTSREICDRFGFRSVNAATVHLRALRKKGFIRKVKDVARGIRLCAPADDGGIPILGQAPAGTPVTGYATPAERLDISHLFAGHGTFAVKVRGDSMQGSGILDGDMVIVRTQPEVPEGAVALAYVDEEVTIKRLQRHGTGYRLMPDNPAYQPIDVAADTPGFRIGGQIIGVVRVM